MGNKVIFENEEDFKSWWFECGIGIIGCHEYNVIKSRCIEHGYIRKSAVEEAEEIINNYAVAEIMEDENKVRKLCFAFVELKAENERWKG